MGCGVTGDRGDLVAGLHISDYLHLYGAPQLPNLGVFGIDIFFVISGFILSSVAMREREKPSSKTMWRFLSRRLIRIYPVYWIFARLAMFRLWRSGQLFAQSYLAAFFLLPPLQYPAIPLLNTFAWTLIFEMTFYFLLALLMLQTVKFAPYALITVLCVSVGGGVNWHSPANLDYCLQSDLAGVCFWRIDRGDLSGDREEV